MAGRDRERKRVNHLITAVMRLRAEIKDLERVGYESDTNR